MQDFEVSVIHYFWGIVCCNDEQHFRPHSAKQRFYDMIGRDILICDVVYSHNINKIMCSFFSDTSWKSSMTGYHHMFIP